MLNSGLYLDLCILYDWFTEIYFFGTKARGRENTGLIILLNMILSTWMMFVS